MNRFYGIDTIMTTLGLGKSKDFQAWWNDVMARNENQDLNIEGFTWDRPQLYFTYEFLEAQGNIEAMATYVDLNSPALPAGKAAPLAKLTGSIPRQKYRIVRGENDYRKQLITLQEVAGVASFNGANVNESLESYLVNYLYDTLVDIPNAHKNSLNYQVGQMKSKAMLEINDANNPRGIKGVSFKAQVPESNFTDEDWFTKDAEGNYTVVEGADPVASLRKKIREMKWQPSINRVTVELDEEFAIDHLLRHPAVLKEVGYMLNPLLMVSPSNDKNATAYASRQEDSTLKEYLRRAIGADEVIFHNTIVGVEKLNTETKLYERKPMKAFEEGVILLRPSGNVGVIKNVVPLRPDGSAITAGIFGGRGIVEYIYNAQTRTQDWQSELTILAVPTRPHDMYYYNVVGEAVIGA